MSEQQNVAVVNRAAERWNAGDLAGYLELYAPSIVLHGIQGVEPGFDSARQFYEAFWSAFSDSRLTFEQTIAKDDTVTIRFALRGTHCGELMGIPASGRPIDVPGITILRFEDSRCVERWSQTDFLGLLQQIGAIPAPAAAR